MTAFITSLALLVIVLTYLPLAAQPIPTEIKSIVAFVFAPTRLGTLGPVGTGFFVGVKHPNQDLAALYFVTSKHVLKANDNALRSAIHVRVNTKDGKTELLSTPLIIQGPNKNVFVHTEASVDLAVITGGPSEQKHEFKFLPAELIATRDEHKKLNIVEGSEIFFTGLFWQHTGKNRNYPVVRFGRVALLTDERISWHGVDTELYLIESSAYGGNSGSPVFFFLGPERVPGSLIVGGRVIRLAGVVQGSFGDVEPIVGVEAAKVPMARTNVGITAVVPAYKLHEILFSSELKSLRGY